MANSKIPHVGLNDTLNIHRTRFNQLIDSVGDLDLLETDVTGTIVGSLNSLDSNMGDRLSLTTTDKTDLVAGINEINAGLDSINNVMLRTPWVHAYDSTATSNFEGSVNISNNLVVGNDFTILGDFILSGTQKTAGQYLQLLDGTTGSPTLSAGMTIDRGSADSAELIWNEAGDQWELGTVGARQRIVYDNGPADLTQVDMDSARVSGNMSIGGNLVLSGNLRVDGTTSTVNSETVTIDDNIIVLNNNVTGTPTENGGIEIERGTQTNAQLLWNETSDRWTVAGAATGTLAYTSEIGNATITLTAGTDLSTGGSFTTNASSNSTITFNHANVTRTNNTSTAAPGVGGTFTAIDTITTSSTGHITAVNTKTVTLPSDANTTYTISAETITGGANLRLTGTDATTDDVKIAAGTNVTVTRTDANTITIASTDTNTTYTAGTGLTLTGTAFSHTAHTGDVTGSAALTIANDAVTYAKMQNVVTANRLLGSTTAGGVISELQVTQAMIAADAVGSPELKTLRTFRVLNSAGTALFTMYGAGA